MGHPCGFLSKKVVVSDFVVVVEVYRSDENQSDIPTLHKCDILGQEVGFLGPVDDCLQLQVRFSFSIWVLVPAGHVPGVAA